MERKWASVSQEKGVNRVKEIEALIAIKQEHYDVLKRSGLEREAKKKILPEIANLNKKKLELIEEIDINRRKATKQLLKCLCSADLATVCADEFAEIYEQISYGTIKKEDNSASKMLNDIAKQFNDFVCIIDKGGNDAVSYYYADMAEECISEANKAIDSVVEKWMKTKKGEQYF